MSSFDKAKETLAGVKAAAPAPAAAGDPVYTKGLNPSTFGGSAPNVIVDPEKDSAGISLLKAGAYSKGWIDEKRAKTEVAMSERVKACWSMFPHFSGHPRACLVVASPRFLPTTFESGHEIHGAKAIKTEMEQRLAAGMDTMDADAIRWQAKRAGYATKALNTLSDITGGSNVPPPSLGDMIELQRNMEAFASAGARELTLPPNGRITFPKLQAGSTGYWVGETATVTASTPATGALQLEAKKAAVRVEMTNELMRFADNNTEAMVRMDMALQGSLLIDLAMLEGTGGTQIKGLITYPTQTSWSQGTDKLLAPAPLQNPAPNANTGYLWQPADVYNLEGSLADGIDMTAWVMRRQFAAVVFNRRADAVQSGDGKGLFVFDPFRKQMMGPEPELAGAKVVRTSQVSKTRTRGTATGLTYVVGGRFSDWITARLGIFEFVVDPYTELAQWQTVLQAIQYIDAGPRHPASFFFQDQLQIA